MINLPATTRPRYRLGFDIGGTFTDFVLYETGTGSVTLHKSSTTPDDPARGALEGLQYLLRQAKVSVEELEDVVHGTTLVTNAIIERRGAKVGFLTTRGFRDVLELGREQRYDIYDLFLEFPGPLVPRRLCREVSERIDRDGRVVLPLELGEVCSAIRELVATGVEAVAVCFLHAYKNGAHERMVREIIETEHPDIMVSLSSEVVPEIREYERATTTVANAYVQPLMDRYLEKIERALRELGFGGRFLLVHSAGGLAAPDTARAYPIRLLESGPAGGAIAAAFFGSHVGKKDLIAFDMGGTTAKGCLIHETGADVAPVLEAARVHRFKAGSGLPIKAPVIDMIEIGAGGGSIASIDELGLLKVGPHSAGAVPGPACYGYGGTLPTVTDANLVLGYLNPGYFLGGRQALSRAAAEQVMAELGRTAGQTAVAAAWGIYALVCENMAAALRMHLVEKGRDPRAYAIAGFGGAGPAHAARVARILGVKEVIIPPASGAASAFGFLGAPLSFEMSRSAPSLLDENLDFAFINDLLGALEADTRRLVENAGEDPNSVRVTREADMRLVGQLHEINVQLPDGSIDPQALTAIVGEFTRQYKTRYAYVDLSAGIQLLNWRVKSKGASPVLSLSMPELAGKDVRSALKGTRAAYFEDSLAIVDVPVYDRYALVAGFSIEGPAIVEERESTTVVPPGDLLWVDERLNLRLKIGQSKLRDAIITAQTEREAAIAQIESDPIGLEIMWSRLITIAEECWHTVCRTAFSLIIAEAQDFACELLDANGRPLAHSPRAMPVFNLTLPVAVSALLERFPPESLVPGDVLVTNDPWFCAGHLFDIAVVTPIFRGERLVALAGTVGHVSDIGGTKESMRAREIFEEGLQIPPMKLFRAGVANEDLFALLAENVRNPRQVIGDVHALVAANAVGAQRLSEFMDEYGMHDLEALAEIVQGRSERAMREAIERIPDGVYEATVTCNPLGEPVELPVKIVVAADQIEVDYTGAPPQVPQGGVNCTLSYARGHTVYPLKCLLTPNIRGNAGCFQPIGVTIPEGTVLNCRRPAAVNLRTRTGWYLAPAVFQAFASALPDRVPAFTGLPTSIGFYGTNVDGSTYSDHLFMGGGQGAHAGRDGKSGLLWPTSASNTSVELFESRAPVLVLEKAFVADSGGPGRTRGGLGQRVRARKLYANNEPVLVSVFPQGAGIEAPGLFGGKAGLSAKACLTDPGGAILRDYGVGAVETLTSVNEILELQLGGGSGFGNPLERRPEAIEADFADGYITDAGAWNQYRWLA